MLEYWPFFILVALACAVVIWAYSPRLPFGDHLTIRDEIQASVNGKPEHAYFIK